MRMLRSLSQLKPGPPLLYRTEKIEPKQYVGSIGGFFTSRSGNEGHVLTRER